MSMEQEGPSILDVGISMDDVMNTPELEVFPEGCEKRLEIRSATCKKDKNQNPMIALQLSAGETGYKTISHYLFLPNADDDAEKRQNKLLKLKSFFKCFGYNYAGTEINTELMVGCAGWCVLSVREHDGQMYNDVKRYNVPK